MSRGLKNRRFIDFINQNGDKNEPENKNQFGNQPFQIETGVKKAGQNQLQKNYECF